MRELKSKQRACIYCRISLDKGGEQLGVQRQEKRLRTIAKVAGYEVVEVITDNDVSATSSRKRPGFEQLLRGIADGRYDVVLALDSDDCCASPATWNASSN